MKKTRLQRKNINVYIFYLAVFRVQLSILSSNRSILSYGQYHCHFVPFYLTQHNRKCVLETIHTPRPIEMMSLRNGFVNSRQSPEKYLTERNFIVVSSTEVGSENKKHYDSVQSQIQGAISLKDITLRVVSCSSIPSRRERAF